MPMSKRLACTAGMMLANCAGANLKVTPSLSAIAAARSCSRPISVVSPWCTDQRDGRTDPHPRPGSRDADGLRAAEFQHPVQDMDADGGLGRPARVGARAERVPDHPLVAGGR